MIQIIVGGIVGIITVLAVLLGRPKYVPRLTKKQQTTQAKLKKGSGHFEDGKDEDDKPLKYYHGERFVADLTDKHFKDCVIDKSGDIVVARTKDQTTLYEMISKSDEFNSRKCFGTCVKPHTYKDALNKDGTPNKKPMIVDVPGEW